jgi:sortase (surface protein transpeptidase)
MAPPPTQAVGAIPIAIVIPSAEVDAVVEQRRVIDGVMQDPTGPWVVSWYKDTPRLGAPGNTLMAGHVDYWGVGPSVFAKVDLLEAGDLITIRGDNGKVYTYKVKWVRLFDANDAPMEELVGATSRRALTLITCGGKFDPAAGVYLERIIVRANYVGSSTPR